jgi:hypothetical protein
MADPKKDAKFWSALDIDDVHQIDQIDEKSQEKDASADAKTEIKEPSPKKNAALEKALTAFLVHDALNAEDRIIFAEELYTLLTDWTTFNKATLLRILYKTMIMLKPVDMEGSDKRKFCVDLLLLSVNEFSFDAETKEKLQYWITNNIDMIADAFYEIAPEQFKMDPFCIIVN